MVDDLKDIIAHNLERLRKLNNKSMSEIAESIGVSQSTVSDWANGKKMPRSGSIQKLADYFGVPKTELLMDTEKQISNISISAGVTKIPILGTITCGEPILAVQNLEGYRTEMSEGLPQGELFYLKTRGDSMEPTIPSGSFALIRKQPDVEDGEIAAVVVNGDDEATLKRVKHQNGYVMLLADNPKYAPIIITSDTPARIIGKAMKVSFDL
ncbi:helix-turn-helix domain-containing protein [Enterococcus sp. MJM12]|uniref:Helix-turn-helix domain-containing protein n=1 Tax=Candidatus Enterococcus myersii TaxID=2815322 RepID=A0ABS3H379_9ENTE|nr:XRE family transcriptional regulator [Enterococcus sp. MJM12]MBO0447912.1 helix-turn-helix domain-containing protein [Enterococcus sp. MJM12]DAY50706.1 MAG TPA: Repressor protein CI [Caudoviricetes sp.]